ncbi:hypothetical protein HAZT_HAZT006883 [Hyalella azteca]|uniref:glutaminyl-peptide cyclotransferase n=1 Tax=Hyalella azteca TaxID=294128 RepID=A0A6A0HBT6_HYAAZ|nr:hypothetical protein HAZT_HAZT006883 [Hyalella azteca]
MQKLVAMGDEQHFQQVLQPILVPRHIVDTLRGLQWTVDEAQFQDRTPIANDVTFTNIIATLDPLAPRRLVLACHYDSLKTNSGRFVGATDSAVPCAQLLNLAYVLRDALQAHREQGNEVTLQLLFFDGEEAFDLFVLLDLLGVKNPKFYNYFSASEPWYARLVSFERRLKALGLYQGLRDMFLQEDWFNPGIEDDHIPFLERGDVVSDEGDHIPSWSVVSDEGDHIPFLERGVPILHLIPYPFPAAWHKDGDNAASLDAPTIALQNSLFRALVVDYLHLVL